LAGRSAWKRSPLRIGAAALRRVLRLCAIYVALVGVFTLSLTLVYALPQQSIPMHLAESAGTLSAESPFPIVRSYAYMLDNYTDALMLDTTYRQPSDSPLYAAMASTKELPQNDNPVDALTQTATGVRSSPSHYSYYWSGYQVVLRPLVILFNYSQIRYLNLVGLLLLSSVVMVQLRRVAGWNAAIALMAAVLICGFFMAPWSLQYSNMTYLMLWAVLAVLVALEHRSLDRLDWEIFFVTGALAAFFDLLTVPLLTLGLPLAVVLIARSRSPRRSGLRTQAAYSVVMSGIWALGYVGSWCAKWTVGQVVLREDVWGAAVKEVFFRAGLSDHGVSRADAIFETFFQMFPMSLAGSLEVGKVFGLLVLGVLAIVFVCFLFLRRTAPQLDRDAAVLLVVPLPYLWYVVASNHSLNQKVYTYRIQAIAVFALLYFALCVLEAMVGTRRLGASGDGDPPPVIG
jgi:hypothetical protein